DGARRLSRNGSSRNGGSSASRPRSPWRRSRGTRSGCGSSSRSSTCPKQRNCSARSPSAPTEPNAPCCASGGPRPGNCPRPSKRRARPAAPAGKKNRCTCEWTRSTCCSLLRSLSPAQPGHSGRARPRGGPVKHSTPEFAAIAERGTVLRCQVGSEVHGIAVPGHGDRDEIGMCIEPPEYVIGLRSFEQYLYRTQPEGSRSGP